MAKATKITVSPLIDAVRQMDADGPLLSLICSTYGLSLENFFEQDFLPTVLGLGGVRDRGYAVPVAMERKLKDTYSALVADAHALADGGRPSLQIDILPVGHRTNHAKIVLLHRKRLIRLVIASANLTHEGYRRQREIAVVLDFKDGGLLPVEVLRHALEGWSRVLGELSTQPLRKALVAAIRQADVWTLPEALPTGRKLEVVFGGGAQPLWQALVEAWPDGEPLLDWCVCSPFWPESTGGETPFEVIARGLAKRNVRLEDAQLRIMTCADSPGEKGRPMFPFRLARRLCEGDFPVRKGTIAAARLEALREEIPEGMAENHRELHAKWVLLRGPSTAVILIGSANFTRKGLGVGNRPDAANIEACVLLTLPAETVDPEAWMRPLAEQGVVDLASCQESQFSEPMAEEDSDPPWPYFIARIEIEVRWQDGPDPVGALRVIPRRGPHPAFTISIIPEHNESPCKPPLSRIARTEHEANPITIPVEAQSLRRVLTNRAIQVSWGEPTVSVRFPVNIDEDSKDGLPSVLGARPDEQQLLAYFHGRITEEDLIELLEQRAAQALTGELGPTPQEAERLRRLQSYLLRDFVESLFGLGETLRQSMRSPRAFQQALVGDFSPVSLAEQVLNAFRAGRRSPTAAAFQFVELIHVVAGLQFVGEEVPSQGDREALEEVRARGLASLLAFAGRAGEREDFRQTCGDRDFFRYVTASLPLPLAKQWANIVLKDTSTVADSCTSGGHPPMIPRLDSVVDLGRDQKRMSDEDPRRQPASVNKLLEAFFGSLESRTEIQLLADEVGMGKTFVALATAYAVLDVLRHKPSEEQPPDLKKCYRAVIVVTPAGNHALTAKWEREVEAFRTRCSRNPEVTRWFQSRICTTPEELVESLCRAHDLRRDPTKAPCVIVCQGNIFTRRMKDAGERLRFLTACLFRWWGNKLNKEERYHIVRRAEEVRGFSSWGGLARRVGTGEYEVNLWDFREHETYLSPSQRAKLEWPPYLQSIYEQTPFTYTEVAMALDQYSHTSDGERFLHTGSEGEAEPQGLLPYCKWVADRRGHAEWYFNGFKDRLLVLYRELIPTLLKNMKLDLPLVIADEAHHWRHSQRQDCQAFRRYLAPLARRLLMLTATPFQLHRDELLEVLATGDSMEPAIGADRVQSLRGRRDQLAEAMNASEDAGRAFSREWGALAEQIAYLGPKFSATPGQLPAEEDPRTQEIERRWGGLRCASGEERQEALQGVPGKLRPFFVRALQLRDTNVRLHEVMAPLIVRHRRRTEHRRYWVGREYPPDASGPTFRPDRSQLHLAPGQHMQDGELAQYLLMKVVAEISRGRHRTTLGMDLTGCYTTLWKSSAGNKAVASALHFGQANLLELLKRITGHGKDENPKDAGHPKVKTVVDEALRRWEHGEKSLIFCFRVPTAETLYRLLSQGVERRLRAARNALFASRGTDTGGDFDADKAMQQFRRSLTAREGSGVPLFLDRVLLGWLTRIECRLPALTSEDLPALARLCARAIHNGRPLFRDFERPDRVFLSRAAEHVLAARLLRDPLELPSDKLAATKELLGQIAREDWVRFRYGESPQAADRGAEREDDSRPSEQLARTSLAAMYQLQPEPDPAIVNMALRALEAQPVGNRPRIVDTLLSGPNLFLPLGDAFQRIDQAGQERIRRMRELIFDVTCQRDGWSWRQRAEVLDALMRAFLREDILLRLPRDVFRGEDETWSESLLRGFHQMPPGAAQLEPLAARVEEFLQELSEMGEEERQAHLQYAMRTTATSVVLVTGSSGGDRDAIFSGFNTPLLPEILVCTAVGQEGIDLHRHCRHVVHYDLGWNPAAIEQRTGRTDRIGSKASRERKIAGRLPEDQLPGLDIAMPYLAGTYDERMFERLRTRAQVFDILTGGDPTADQESGAFWLDPDSEGEDDGTSFVPLPRQMLDDLRVNLAVRIDSRSATVASSD